MDGFWAVTFLKFKAYRADLMNIAIVVFSICTILAPNLHAKSPDKDCVQWFQNSKIAPNSRDCELKCASLMLDMNTFMCPDQCDLLCRDNANTNTLEKLIYYPGLTPAEKKLIEKFPKDALRTFFQKTRAELSSIKNFPDQGLNDEADAFRHFIWSGLLTKDLGAERAREFLDAHEANRLQDASEKNMDLFNNQQGQQTARKLIDENKWSQRELESEGLKALREKKLQVLKPGLKIPENPK